MIRAKAVDPRTGTPSWTQLAELAHLGTTTVTNMVARRSKTSPRTIEKIAAALNVQPEQVSQWLDLHRPVRGPYIPTPEAARLDHAERKALDQLITVMVRGRESSDETATKVVDLFPAVAARRRRHPSPEDQ